jgi:hypothetical protein
MSNEFSSGFRVVSTHFDTRFILEHVVDVVQGVEILVLKTDVVLIVWRHDGSIGHPRGGWIDERILLQGHSV